MNDSSTTVAELKSLVDRFVTERRWQKFHSPKNLSMSLAIEAAELMEHFQWLEGPASREVAADPVRRNAAGEELADVLAYLLALANVLEIDIASAIEQKMARNAEKYPADEFRGRFGRNDPSPASE